MTAPFVQTPTKRKQTLVDTLAKMLGVRPNVRYEVPPYGPDALGETFAVDDWNRLTPDSVKVPQIYINPDSLNSKFAPVVLPHEFGHLMYDKNRPESYYDVVGDPPPPGIEPELSGLIHDMWENPRMNKNNPQGDPDHVYRKDATESFAQAFGVAVDQLRASPRAMPAEISPNSYQEPDQNDVRKMRAWLLKQDAFKNKAGVPFSKQEADNTRVVRARRKKQ